uniref:TIGR02302 family protein n=1 Tax=Methylobacterium sp. Leaf118 TaxID=2876562 RepID=UPI001E5B572C
LAHDPASAMEDTLAVGGTDPATRALWAMHQSRAAAAVARLRVGPPRPDMPRHDPRALRAGALVAALAALFVAGPEWRPRIAAAFDWREPPAAAPSFRVDGWIDPPIYTRMPPLIVTMSGQAGAPVQRLRAPVNATLIVRVAGQGEATLTPNAALVPVAVEEGARKPAPRAALNQAAETRAALREERFRLVGGTAELGIAASGSEPQRLVIETIPDHPPEVRQIGGIDVNGRGTFTLTYRAKDDYGIASAEGVVEPLKAGRSLVPVPRIALALPADATGETDTKTLVDLTDNPWSGARVRLTLTVRDEAGQEGRSQAAEVTLPARPFTKAVARSLAEERRRLVTAPDEERQRVQTALDALRIAPERFTPEPAIFLGLTTAANRLRAAKSDEDLTNVADLLWEMALKIEDGDLSDAEKSLRAAQDRLKEAIERGAPDEEIKKLTEDLKQALDKFMKEFAERQRQNPQNRSQQSERQQQQQQQGAKTVTPDDLEKMLKDMQEAMQRGDTAEAQRLLEQLRNVLENLQSAESQGQKSGDGMAEMNKQLDELDKMSRDQQDLRDETFKDGQEGQPRPRPGQRPRQGQQPNGQPQGQPGQRGQPQPGQQGQNQPGEQGQQGQGQKGQQGQSPGQRQQGLREQLQDLKERMKQQGLQGEQGLADAEDAMREAEDALGQGRNGDAVDAQGRALDGLKRGAEGMQKQMQQMAEGEGQGEGEGQNPGQQGRAGSRDDDPLGRPTRGREMSDGQVRVPGADESAVQRARRIMEELRRKLGDPSRPQEELDYFERLLRRN